MAAEYGSLPFDEAIWFFRDKLNVPTTRTGEVAKEANDAAFHVAGAMQADLLADLHMAVDAGIAEGFTLAQFTRDFEAIVEARGWTGWTGEGTKKGRAWRAQIIYETNLRTAYQAGRWAQAQEVKDRRPYLEYRHSDTSVHPRELHKSWDGLVVAIDDPWVQSHWPPNGWGCKCMMFSLSPRDLAKMGKAGPDTPPDDGLRTYTDKVTGQPMTVPNGIDPGWDYAPGASRAEILRQKSLDKAKTLPGGIGGVFKQAVQAAPVPVPAPVSVPAPVPVPELPAPSEPVTVFSPPAGGSHGFSIPQRPVDTRDAIAQQWCNGKITVEPGFDCQRELGISETAFGKLIGAPDGTRVTVKKQYGAYLINGDGGPLETFERLLSKKTGIGLGNMHNEELVLDKSMRGSGLGAHLFAMQVKALSKAGVRFLDCHAAGHFQHPLWNGYYTWPRLGYDALLPNPIKSMLPEALRAADSLLDLMATPEGREFWRVHGEPMDVVFDLSPGSRSMQVLDAYLTEKGYRL